MGFLPDNKSLIGTLVHIIILMKDGKVRKNRHPKNNFAILFCPY